MTRLLKCPRYGTDGRKIDGTHPEYIDPNSEDPPPFECEHCGRRGRMIIVWRPAQGILWCWCTPSHDAPVCGRRCMLPGSSYVTARGNRLPVETGPPPGYEFHVGRGCPRCRAARFLVVINGCGDMECCCTNARVDAVWDDGRWRSVWDGGYVEPLPETLQKMARGLLDAAERWGAEIDPDDRSDIDDWIAGRI